jgi:hypothetical protein
LADAALAQVPGNDAEELLPVTAFEKVIKTTIRQAASPVTRQDMWEAYKARNSYSCGEPQSSPGP